MKRNSTYAIYFTWKEDNFKDSFNVYSTVDRDLNLAELKIRTDISEVSWCRIYSSGEYGRTIKVK